MSIIDLLEQDLITKRLKDACFNTAYNTVCAFLGVSSAYSTYSKILTIRTALQQPYLYIPMKIDRSKIFK